MKSKKAMMRKVIKTAMPELFAGWSTCKMTFAAFICLVISQAVCLGADETLFYDDFDGSGTAYLNGTTPDITSGGAKWVAMNNGTTGSVYADGRIDVSGGLSANRGGSATLAFIPQKHYVYTLDLSAISLNSTASHTTAGRLYFGFARGQSANSGNGYKLLPSDATVQGQVIQIFNVKQGYTGANNLWEYSANDTSLARWIGWAGGYGGDIDLRVVLDTRVTGNWTAVWYARRPSYPEWLETRAAETVTDTDITSVGFGLNTYTSGSVTSFKLTGVYKPARTIILLR
jgi:hypothetical protein